MEWFQGYLVIAFLYSFIFFGIGSKLLEGQPAKWVRFIAIIILTSTFITSIALVIDGLAYLINGTWVDPFLGTDFSGCRGRTCILIIPLKFLGSSYPWFVPIVFGGVALASFGYVSESVSILTNTSLREKDIKDQQRFIRQKRDEKQRLKDLLNTEPDFLKYKDAEGWLIDKDLVFCKRFYIEKNTNNKIFIVEQTGKIIPNKPPLITKRILLTPTEAKSDWKYYLNNGWLPTDKKWD